MLRITTLYSTIIIFKLLRMVSSEDISPDDIISCRNPKGYIFESLNVTSFVDKNRYIRLNISWEEPKANFTSFEMLIDTNCSALYSDTTISVDQKFLIEPSVERIPHPAEPLLHGCKYDFELYAEATFKNQSCIIWQTTSYEIPDCVNEVCKCGVAGSPYKYQGIRHVGDEFYEITFDKTDRNVNLDLEALFHGVMYTNMDSNKTVTTVHPGEIIFYNNNNSIIVPLNEIHGGNSYKMYIDLVLDGCEYYFSEELYVPEEFIYRARIDYVTYPLFIILICTSLALLAYMKTNRQMVAKLRRYFPFLSPLPVWPTTNQEESNSKITKEVINTQYTPLEFIVNAHNFDRYEFPRNKIILKQKVGGGSFGHVYMAEIYDLDNKPGFTMAAAKKPIENAPPEEIADFLDEIKTMKKIADCGGNPNVIRILACVTIDTPYLMVMELVPCGSLKTYLSNLRKEWEQRKQQLQVRDNNQHFFPDNMVVEHYLNSFTTMKTKEDSGKLKYSQLAFDDYTSCSVSSGTESYITPDTPRTPSTPESPLYSTSTSKMSSKLLKPIRPRFPLKRLPSCSEEQSPLTPDSITSSALPSATNTLLTPLESATAILIENDTYGEQLKPVLDSKELQNFALQIASGMAFLEKLEITHRDLAARNILINTDKTLKISDFGMARAGIYVNTTQKRQPLRWMAPEAIKNRRCDNKTDVWSFGVVLWEIGSLGAFPYKDLSNDLVITHIMQGERLDRPQTCTDELYDLMQKCWQTNPDDRPTFEEIARQLQLNNGKIYVDFSEISPKYVFPPTQ